MPAASSSRPPVSAAGPSPPIRTSPTMTTTASPAAGPSAAFAGSAQPRTIGGGGGTGCNKSSEDGGWCLDHQQQQHLRFYFVVFPNNSAPIFHSNRIPATLLEKHCEEVATTTPTLFPTSHGTRTASPLPSASSSSSSPSPSQSAAAVSFRATHSTEQTAARTGGPASSTANRPETLNNNTTTASSTAAAGSGSSSPPLVRSALEHDHRSTCPACILHWKKISGELSLQAGAVGGGAATAGAFLATHATAALHEEVPQQTLQAVAFPTAFGVVNVRGPQLPLRTPGPTRRPSPVASRPRSPAYSRRGSTLVLSPSTTASPALVLPPPALTMNRTAVAVAGGHAVVGPSAPTSSSSSTAAVGATKTTPQPPSAFPPHRSASPPLSAFSSPPPPGSSLQPSPPVLVSQPNEGPPWNMRVEDVRNAKGELRFYRIVVTASFTTLVTTHTGPMHSMQTHVGAVALVLTLPSSGVSCRFLLQHVDVLRSMLHRTLQFGMRTMQRFFVQLLSLKQRGPQMVAIKNISAQLERHPEAVETYQALWDELNHAVQVAFPLPPLRSRSGQVWYPFRSVRQAVNSAVMARAAGSASAGGPATHTQEGNEGYSVAEAAAASAQSRLPPSFRTTSDVSTLLYEALTGLHQYSAPFTSAFVAGLLAVSGGAPLGAKNRAAATGGGGVGHSQHARAESEVGHSVGHVASADARDRWPTAEGSFAASTLSGGEIATGVAGGGGGGEDAFSAYWTQLAVQRDEQQMQQAALQQEDQQEPAVSSPAPRKALGDGAAPLPRELPTAWSGVSVGETVSLSATVSSLSAPGTPLPEAAPAGSAAPPPSPLATRPTDLSQIAAGASVSSSGNDKPAQAERTHANGATARAKGERVAKPTISNEVTGPPRLNRVAGSASASAPPRGANPQPPSSSLPQHSSGVGSAAPPPPLPPPSAAMSATDGSYRLSSHRRSRVIVFATDEVLARRLLFVAAFFLRQGNDHEASESSELLRGTNTASGTVDDLNNDALWWRRLRYAYTFATAAQVSSCAYASVPIQWIAEEFSEDRLPELASPFSPETTLLIVSPRSLLCRRLQLRKMLESRTILIEQHSGQDVQVRSAAFPFRCSIVRDDLVQPDAMVATLLQEGLSLQKSSNGTVRCAAVFDDMWEWLRWQSYAYCMQREYQLNRPSCVSVAPAPMGEGESHGGGGGACSAGAVADSARNGYTTFPNSTDSRECAAASPTSGSHQHPHHRAPSPPPSFRATPESEREDGVIADSDDPNATGAWLNPLTWGSPRAFASSPTTSSRPLPSSSAAVAVGRRALSCEPSAEDVLLPGSCPTTAAASAAAALAGAAYGRGRTHTATIPLGRARGGSEKPTAHHASPAACSSSLLLSARGLLIPPAALDGRGGGGYGPAMAGSGAVKCGGFGLGFLGSPTSAANGVCGGGSQVGESAASPLTRLMDPHRSQLQRLLYDDYTG